MKKIKEIIIVVLLFLIAGAVYYLFQLKKENDTFKQEILNEKRQLEKELEVTLQDLHSNQEQNIAVTNDFSNANQKLKVIRTELKNTQKVVQHLKQELASSKESSFNQLQKLRNVLGDVKKNNEQLFKSLDSIKSLNDSLMVTIAVTKSELNTEKLQSKALELKLSEATKIQIAKVEVYAVEQKKSGKIKETDKYSKANGIQVKYNVLNNKALKGTESDVYYVLKNEDGLIVASNGEFLFGGSLKKFTDGTRIVLDGNTQAVNDIISLGDVTLQKGAYTLEFYSTDGMLAKESFTLKKRFLGVF